MKFLVDRCAGRRIVLWLRGQGHDVFDARDISPDPGDRELLRLAVESERVVITLDSDFPTLVFLDREPHAGMVRLPDVPARARIQILEQVLARHTQDLQAEAIITVKGGRIRISHSSSR